jgi:citrate/tricarballylate utilization protein
LLLTELVKKGEHVMTVCNSCRYCEQYCPVFPAMERRVTFAKEDLVYLANLCHNCGECLYACQYAPPHEFGIDVPRTLAQLRLGSYEEYCWPRRLAGAFRRQGVRTAAGLAVVLSLLMLVGSWLLNPVGLLRPVAADFYAVIPHAVMVSMFGGVFAFVTGAIVVSVVRFWREVRNAPPHLSDGPPRRALKVGGALSDALTLKYLHSGDQNCAELGKSGTPWRRWFHHSTVYGFLLCFASTSVAASYHSIWGWQAPYPLTSLPVLLGTIGGIGLLIGPAGLLVLKSSRDPNLSDPDQSGMDVSFIFLLFFTSLTGFLLLVLRERALMGVLLIVHLGFVMALFVCLPYGKFMHGIYRTVALAKYGTESA